MPTITSSVIYAVYDYIFPPSEPGKQWRDRASTQAALRTKAQQEAQLAWQKGDREISKKLSQQAKAHYREMEHFNSKAEQSIYTHYNTQTNADQLQQIDLHGLFVSEALVRARAHLEACRKARVARTTFITGRGNRSADGVAKIKAAVQDWLKDEKGVTLDESETEKNPGIVVALIQVDESTPLEDESSWPWKAGETVARAVTGTVKSLFSLVSTAPQSGPLVIEPPKSATITGYSKESIEIPPSPAPPGAFNQKLPPIKSQANEEPDDDWEVVTAPVARSAKSRPATKTPRTKSTPAAAAAK